MYYPSTQAAALRCRDIVAPEKRAPTPRTNISKTRETRTPPPREQMVAAARLLLLLLGVCFLGISLVDRPRVKCNTASCTCDGGRGERCCANKVKPASKWHTETREGLGQPIPTIVHSQPPSAKTPSWLVPGCQRLRLSERQLPRGVNR